MSTLLGMQQNSLEILLKQLSTKALLEVYNKFSSSKIKKFSSQPTALNRTVTLLVNKKITADILISRFKKLIPVPAALATVTASDEIKMDPQTEFGNLEENGKPPIPGRRLLIFIKSLQGKRAPTFADLYEVIPLDKDALRERIEQWIHMDFIQSYRTKMGNRELETYQIGPKGNHWLEEKGAAAAAHVAKYPWKRSEQPKDTTIQKQRTSNLQKICDVTVKKEKSSSKSNKVCCPTDAKIQMLAKENPRRAGTITWNSFNKIKAGMTVDAYLKAGGRLVDLKWDIAHGHLSLK